MRTTTMHNQKPFNRFASRHTIKLPVDFKPERSAVLPVHIVASREYLRDLRAAEMSAWESSGGDFLASWTPASDPLRCSSHFQADKPLINLTERCCMFD